MLKREWCAENNRKLLRLFIPIKLQPVPEFAVEDLPLGRTTALVPEFAVKCSWVEYDDDDIVHGRLAR